VRRETGKEYVVKVHCDEGAAIHVIPDPCAGVLSPLLANLYMRRFVLGWKMLGLERSLGSRIVT
jgi:hypothetical protein